MSDEPAPAQASTDAGSPPPSEPNGVADAPDGTILTATPAEGDPPEPAPEPGANPDEPKADGEKDPKGEGDEPITYENFSMPEGFEVDQSALDTAIPVFQELGLNQEQGQKLVDLFTQMQTSQVGKISEAAQAQVDGWAKEIQTEWGGKDSQTYKDNLSTAAKALDFGDKLLREALPDEERTRTVDTKEGQKREAVRPLREAFDQTGAGNHPAIIKFVKSIGEMLGEDGIAPTVRAKSTETIADRWYGGSANQ